MINVKDVLGLWERSLIAWPDGREDRTTFVAWLQGPNLFGDLRQPASPPSFDGVACLNDLGSDHFGWLAQQEGFAGTFTKAGDAFEWRRTIDFQCPSGAADAGYLEFSDGVLIERGRDIPYIEHWHHTSPNLHPHFAVRMRDSSGLAGFLVRVGDIFIYVRNRGVVLPDGGTLSALVTSATPQEARALLDCEISLGRVRDGTWLIGRSTLPFRVRTDLAPEFSSNGETVTVRDLSPVGESFSRRWAVVERDIDEQQQKYSGQGHGEGELSVFDTTAGRT